RGKVDANIALKSAVGAQRGLALDQQLLDELLARVDQVRDRLKQPAPVSPLELLRWPGVVREAEVDAAPVLAAALGLLREALDDLNETRQREGQRIRELLLTRCVA